MKKGLVLEGGGILGISYIGCIKELYNNNIKFNHFIGTSVGSIICAALSCNIPIDEIENSIMNLNLNNFKQNRYWIFGNFYRLFKNWGWFMTNNLESWIEDTLYTSTGIHSITFQQIYDKFGNYLIIPAYSLTEQKIHYFDISTSPNLSVSKACVMSCSIPLYFQTQSYNNNIYVDGGLIDNYPIQKMVDLVGIQNTIGLKLINNNKQHKISNLTNYIRFLINKLLELAIEKHVSTDNWNITLPIYVNNIDFLNFNISNQNKKWLIHQGKSAAIKYIQNIQK